MSSGLSPDFAKSSCIHLTAVLLMSSTALTVHRPSRRRAVFAASARGALAADIGARSPAFPALAPRGDLLQAV